MAWMAIVQMIQKGVTNTISAIGQYQAGEAAEEAGHYNAEVARRQATIVRGRATFEAAKQRDMTHKLLATSRARAGASGLGFGGSPLEVMAATAQEAELDARAIEYGGELEAVGYESQATLAEWEGKQIKRAKRTRALLTLLDFGGENQGDSSGMPMIGGQSTSSQTQSDITRYNQYMAVK